MIIDIDVVGKLVAPILTAIVGFIAKRYFEARPNLITYLVHASAIPLQGEKPTNVNTYSIVVRNSGKRTAHNIRIGHNFLPAFQISPRLTSVERYFPKAVLPVPVGPYKHNLPCLNAFKPSQIFSTAKSVFSKSSR